MMGAALETFREWYQQRDGAARAWKQQGGRVVGYLCDNVPEELILAAGFLPYRLSARPGVGSEAIEQYVGPFAAPFSARNRGVAFTDAMLNLLLSNGFDFLDYLIVPHTRKTIQAFYRELSLAREASPDLTLPELYYLDRAYTPFYTSEVFNRRCVLDLRTTLERWSGAPITDVALEAAIASTNRRRELLQRLATQRAANPPRWSGVDALQVIGACAFAHPDEVNPLLERLLDEDPTEAAARPGPRLFEAGSPLDHTLLYQAIEDCGATVVAEDHCWGNRCGEFPIDPALPAVEGLADRFHRKPACSIDFPMQRVVDRCMGRAQAASVDGAIFYVFEGDGVHVWDTPDEVAALEARNVPCLYLKQQPYWSDDPESLRATLRDFIGTLEKAKA